MIFEDRHNVEISVSTVDGKRLVFPDKFLRTPEQDWLKKESLPDDPIRIWDTEMLSGFDFNLTDKKLPIIFGIDINENVWLCDSGEEIVLGIDILGSSFFMLTRYEELIDGYRDNHNRFPATQSFAFKNGFLQRPIINEYLEVLWSCFLKLWPTLKRKEMSFATFLSHDVDAPFAYTFKKPLKICKMVLGNYFRTQNLKGSFDILTKWRGVRNGNVDLDPYYTFPWIMDLAERAGLKSTFFFLSGQSSSNHDGDYDITHPVIRQLLRDIHLRGHNIGFHFSYNTYLSKEQMIKEVSSLKKVCLEED